MLRLHTWAFPAIVLLGVLQSLSEGFGIGLFIPLLHGLVGGTPPTRGGWLVGRMDGLFQHVPADERQAVIALCLFAVVLATATLSYTHGILFMWVDGRIAHQLRGRIFEQLLTVGFGAIERDRSGRLLNVLASDTWRTSEALKILVHLIITTSTVVVYVVLLLLMSWRLTLVVALGMLLVSGVVRLFTKGARELGENVTRSQLRAGAPDGRRDRRHARHPRLRTRALRTEAVRRGVGSAASGDPPHGVHRRAPSIRCTKS